MHNLSPFQEMMFDFIREIQNKIAKDARLYRTFKEYRTALQRARKEEASQSGITTAREKALELNRKLYNVFFERYQDLKDQTDRKSIEKQKQLIFRLDRIMAQEAKILMSMNAPFLYDCNPQLNDMEITS